MIPCNMLHMHAGIDWKDPDPDAGFIIVQRECGKPARYGHRLGAGSSPETVACDACMSMMDPDVAIDFWPLKLEHQP